MGCYLGDGLKTELQRVGYNHKQNLYGAIIVDPWETFLSQLVSLLLRRQFLLFPKFWQGKAKTQTIFIVVRSRTHTLIFRKCGDKGFHLRGRVEMWVRRYMGPNTENWEGVGAIRPRQLDCCIPQTWALPWNSQMHPIIISLDITHTLTIPHSWRILKPLILSLGDKFPYEHFFLIWKSSKFLETLLSWD